jgi:predicted Fe-Mo cluster-binding NifX family protein
MKLCVTAASNSLDAQLDPRFGRCAYFIMVDLETMQSEAVPNSSQDAASGAGIQAAQLIAAKGAQRVLTGRVGPNAVEALSAARVEITTGASGTVKEAVEQFKHNHQQAANH